MDWDDDELKTLPPLLDLDGTETDVATTSAARPPWVGGDYKFSKSTLAWLEDTEGFELLLTSTVSSSSHFRVDRRTALRLAGELTRVLTACWRDEFLYRRPAPLPCRKLSAGDAVARFDVADDPHLEVRADRDRISVRLESARARLWLRLESAVAITLHDILVGSWRHWDPHESGAHDAPNRISTCPWCVFWIYDGQAA